MLNRLVYVNHHAWLIEEKAVPDPTDEQLKKCLAETVMEWIWRPYRICGGCWCDRTQRTLDSLNWSPTTDIAQAKQALEKWRKSAAVASEGGFASLDTEGTDAWNIELAPRMSCDDSECVRLCDASLERGICLALWRVMQPPEGEQSP